MKRVRQVKGWDPNLKRSPVAFEPKPPRSGCASHRARQTLGAAPFSATRGRPTDCNFKKRLRRQGLLPNPQRPFSETPSRNRFTPPSARFTAFLNRLDRLPPSARG